MNDNDLIIERIIEGDSWQDLVAAGHDVTMQNLTVILLKELMALREQLLDE